MSIPLTIPDDWTPAQALAVYDKRVFDRAANDRCTARGDLGAL